MAYFIVSFITVYEIYGDYLIHEYNGPSHDMTQETKLYFSSVFADQTITFLVVHVVLLKYARFHYI